MRNHTSHTWTKMGIVLFLVIFETGYCATDIAYATSTQPSLKKATAGEASSFRETSEQAGQVTSAKQSLEIYKFFNERSRTTSTLSALDKAGEILVTLFELAKKVVRFIQKISNYASIYAIKGFHSAGSLFESVMGVSFLNFSKGLWKWFVLLLNTTLEFLKNLL